MKWKHIPGDPASMTLDGHMDRVVIEDLEGDDNALAYLGQIALFFSDNNIRTGYQVEVIGSCNKVPQGINWGPITVTFEESDGVKLLVAHLESAWGPQEASLWPTIEPDDAARARAYL